MTNTSIDILYVIGELNVGGTERHLSNVARALSRSGWRVCVYSLAGDGPLRKEMESAGVKVILPPVDRTAIPNSLILRALRMLLSSLYLVYVMARKRPRIVHFFLPAAYLIGAIAASFARIKIRIMSRRSLNTYQESYPVVRSLEIKLHRRMKAVLGNSDAVVRQLRDDEHIPLDKLGLIYNGIAAASPSSDNRAAVRSALGIDASALVYIIVANLIPYKGHLDLIAALGIAKDRIGQPWHLLVVGRDDGAGPGIRAMAEKLDIESRISILGLRSDVADLLFASDVALLCSHQEGFSNAILEAMSLSLPMIVTDVGGNAEAVVNNETGVVVPARDPQALAEPIVLFARDPLLREKYGIAGRKRIQDLFLLDACVAKYDALYRGLLNGKPLSEISEVHYAGR